MKKVPGISDVYLATSKDERNEPLIEESKKLGVKYYAGSEEDILERHIGISEAANADAVLRVTCDMPLFDVDSLSRESIALLNEIKESGVGRILSEAQIEKDKQTTKRKTKKIE